MKKFNYRTLKVCGTRESIERFLEMEYAIWDENLGAVHKWGFINIITGIASQMKCIIYYKRSCWQVPGYMKTITGLIHGQLVADNLEWDDTSESYGCFQDHLNSHWVESRLTSRRDDSVVIAYDLPSQVNLEIWKQYLSDVYLELNFVHSFMKLENRIEKSRSSVIYNLDWWPFDNDVDRPEETVLADLDLV